MVSKEQLALELVGWVALFIPALAIMLGTLSNVYDNNSPLEIIGYAEHRKTEMFMVSTVAFIAAFLTLILSLVYLMYSIGIPLVSDSLSMLLSVAILCVLIAAIFTIAILVNIYRVGKVQSFADLSEFQDLAEDSPIVAGVVLNELGQNNQLSQQELDEIAESVSLYERLADLENQKEEEKRSGESGVNQ